MKMHGHTTIELTDTSTGAVERYDDDNTVTGLLAHALGLPSYVPDDWGVADYQSSYYCTSYAAMQMPLYQTWLGGLAMFDAAISEDGMAPAGAGLTGSAAYGEAYAGAQPGLGSYNAAESEIASDHVKHVFDFSTNQANGTIASLGLCHAHPARYGAFGFSARKDPARTKVIGSTAYRLPGTPYVSTRGGVLEKYSYLYYGSGGASCNGSHILGSTASSGSAGSPNCGSGLESMLKIGKTGGGMHSWRFAGYDLETDTGAFLQFDSATPGKVRVVFAPNMLRSVTPATTTRTTVMLDGLGGVDVTLPATVQYRGVVPCIVCCTANDPGAYWFAICADTNSKVADAGGSFHLVEIRFDDFTADGVELTDHVMVNNTGSAITRAGSYPGMAQANQANWAIAAGCLVMGPMDTYDTGCAAITGIKISDPTDVFTVSLPEGVSSMGLVLDTDGSRITYTKGLVVDAENRVGKANELNPAYDFPDNFMVSPQGLSGIYNSGETAPAPIYAKGGDGVFAFLVWPSFSNTYPNWGAEAMMLRVLPVIACNRLTTINNLGTPVVKTADKTMKVTYSLTW